MKINQNNAGLKAEKIAATFLTKQGPILIKQNYHCRFGEIDLIMRDGETLVFVEVRLRNNDQFGGPATSITRQKQLKLIATAQHFLQGKPSSPCRFDAFLMDKIDSNDFEWLRNAFDA